ncbi:DUF2147 domain-containing protein [Acinetobacter cumulans]|jgi:uncharacterized protein (DUF2147 family)|uniref:DUF2147 domain-containing protein n=1 Tax=Acinetobacter cumulans TaxID=2136182 RepID=A0A3A8FXV5_9GAMM|nr:MULTISPECIES: DUF2147 domain-containing protein [Acinetobacter]NWK75046.1 DUF2147 domain-containing protein [Acinetobacter sp. SwsAc6]QCO21038.1 DUF2147 domain-containing protein [Acinetobacter cumulans]RKG41095.1 DUF2147 domain-containing protein [Acinetobacter cumulans]RKG47844.1 DUF2147 domain-containing protein [Acinetobacter cumulans]RKG51715.1 DUF2147 domain-containing protein [Acinetobacter cumulans]
MILKRVLSIALLGFCSTLYANDMVGVWKTIDEQTGYSRADVTITKNSDGSYTGKITAIRPLPYKALVETCEKCKGPLKNTKLVGLEILKGFKQNPQHENEFVGGTVLDPLSGNVYKGKAKLNPTGKRLTMRGYIGVSALGRSTTWIRAE